MHIELVLFCSLAAAAYFTAVFTVAVIVAAVALFFSSALVHAPFMRFMRLLGEEAVFLSLRLFCKVQGSDAGG